MTGETSYNSYNLDDLNCKVAGELSIQELEWLLSEKKASAQITGSLEGEISQTLENSPYDRFMENFDTHIDAIYKRLQGSEADTYLNTTYFINEVQKYKLFKSQNNLDEAGAIKKEIVNQFFKRVPEKEMEGRLK